MARDKNLLFSGFSSLQGGVDSGIAPNLILPQQDSWAVNTNYRGGWPMCRPGWIKCNLNWDDDTDAQDAFEDGFMQVVGGYVTDDGDGSLMASIGGRQFRIKLASGQDFNAQEITIAGDPNPSNRYLAWCCQAENYWILQDGQSRPFIYNGASAVRSNEAKKQVPVGNQITYYLGRLWVARGRDYVAGDIVFGPSGTSGNNDRDSILYFTENQYLAEGGSFAVPAQFGDITAMKPIASINTALGQGELIVFTREGVFATLVPEDRTQWKNVSQPLQRIIQLSDGAFAQDSVVNVNEDLFSRGKQGIRSLAYSVRNVGQWGNPPISNEVIRVLANDAMGFLQYGSGVYFDNRMLMTCSPQFSQGHGIYHLGLMSLDATPITNMRQQSQPVWEGMWTGLKILKIVTTEHQTVPRCFMFVLNDDNKIEVWEQTLDRTCDNDGTDDIRIEWFQEGRAFNFGSAYDPKRLETGDLFFDSVSGTVNFNIEYRPDSYPCWFAWDSWESCSQTRLCAADIIACQSLPNFKLGYVPDRQLVQPPDGFNDRPDVRALNRVGFEFQVRRTVTGFCRVKQMRLGAYLEEAPQSGRNIQ